MAEQFTITGVVLPANGGNRLGMRVQAFDRDLPSLERRTGTGPEKLGEVTTDAQGGFQITYASDQFQSGEGTSLFRKPGEKNADLSFRIFDQAGQELSISNIQGNRDVGPDQIIFNAPSQLVVNIFVNSPQRPSISEYDRVLNLVTPIIADISLAQLTDEDLQFIFNELDAGPQSEVQQHIEWLRRCALLAQTSNLPVEAFYGWGRKDVPASISELAAVPLQDLKAVLEKLTELSEDRLRQSLLAAVAENIIPISFRERVDEIVRLLTRRNQSLHEVVAQLLDVDTLEPLAGFTVTTFGQEDGVGNNRGVDITDGDGKFSFSFFLRGPVSPEDPPRGFRLEVISPDGETLLEDGLVSVTFDKPETQTFPALVKVPKPEVSKQQEDLQTVLLDVPDELRSFLAEDQSIQTLADIRRKGGLSQLPGLPASVDPVHIRKLDSLADLDRISSDISVSKTLLDRNFGSVMAIADTPHSEFVSNLSGGAAALSEPEAVKLHLNASAQTQIFDNMLLKVAADNANGFEIQNADGDAVLQHKCGCSDCEAAVSPAAYLSALLDYTLKHIRSDAKKIDLQFLVDTFHQPFIDLPTDCEAVESQLHQVRICVEVLRSYLANRPLADALKETTLAKAEQDFVFAAYAMLLNQIGTSYEEVRRMRAESDENREAFAARMGVDLAGSRPDDELDQLFLDPAAQAPSAHVISEQALERLFGLADTTRDSLSEGAKLGDDDSQIKRWNLNGAVWGQNTDPKGLVHVTLVNPDPAVFRVELYRDLPRTKLVASGEIGTASGVVKLVSESNSQLSGVFEIAYTSDSNVITVAAVPALLSAQLQHLRTLWFHQDHPRDAYSDEASPKFPLIDPDVIGPDDFRVPTPKDNPADPDRAFDIWLQRRRFVDDTLSALKSDRETKGLAEILKRVLGNPLPDLDGLLLVITKGGPVAEIKTVKKGIAALGLTVESFTRLMSIHVKDQLASSDIRNENVSEPEWREVYSILTQALKTKQFDAWRTDEQAVDLKLGFDQFWFSLTESKEGDWPPVASPGQPVIDPDIIKPTDLPDWLAGKDAISLWKTRQAQLQKLQQDFNLERQAKGFDFLLRLALGHPTSGNPLQHELNDVAERLGSVDDSIRSKAIKEITDDFHLTVEDFNRVLQLKAASEQVDPAKQPTATEWLEFVAILVPAHKVKHLYPVWLKEETTGALVYWKGLKAKLPLWRASIERRQTWQQALRLRTQPPIIDPAVMGPDDLQHVIAGDPAFDIWKIRNDRTVVLHDELKTTFAAQPDTLTGLDQIIKDALGFDRADLEALDQERNAGHSIEKRLDQLNLSASAFNYLLRIRGLANASQPITDAEFETVYDTLTRVRLQREFAQMNSQEKDQRIILAPEFFKIFLTPLSVLSTPRWLSTWQARLEWQDTLQSRIDQEQSIAEGLRSAISAVEEATLPALRDALIEASDAAGANLTEQAESVTARLLIDARSGGCRMTTRVAQALETIQTLIFNLRSGQFEQQGASILSLVSDSFDEEWKWIGSYATWRSAMFVFLYPENILQPSLLKDKTPSFEELIKSTRSARLNPQTACQKAESYADYFRDVCSLEIEATCQASTIMYTGQGCDRRASNARSMFYMFARADSGKIYWSAYDAAGSSSASGPTHWQEVEGFAGTKVSQIVGAMPYRKTVSNKNFAAAFGEHGVVQSSYVYLFCIAGEADKKALKLARLSLDEFGKWVGDGTAIDLPVPPLNFSSLEIIPVQTQNEFSRPALVFHKFGDSHVYYRLLNADGVEWEQKNLDWSLFFFIYDGAGHIQSIKTALRVNGELLWFVNTTDSSVRGVELQLLELRPGNKNPVVFKAWTFGNAEFLGAVPGPESAGIIAGFGQVQTSAIYVFWQDSSGSHYRRFSNLTGDEVNNPVQPALTDLIRLSPYSGSAAAGQQMLAYQREKNARAFYMYKFTDTKNKLVGSATFRAAPRVNAPLNIPLHQSGRDLQQRRQEIIDAFALNADAMSSVLTYLREAYYFVPLHLALGLQGAGHHLASLDCFRTIYDYESETGPPNQRNIYYGLDVDAKVPQVPLYEQADGWLLDPLNPHSIAATRHLTYTRFTIMSLVRCLLDFADSEFTQETGESLAKARTLYLTALELLNLPELQQKLDVCDDLIAELRIQPGKDVPAEVPAAVDAILDELTKAAPSIRQFGKAARDAKAKLQAAGEWSVKLTEARAVVHEAIASSPIPLTTGSMVISKSNTLKEQQGLLLAQPFIDNRLKAVSRSVAIGVFNGLGIGAPAKQPDNGKPLSAAPVQPLVLPLITPSLQFCIPPNPILKALRLHAELNLFKLRTCRNIAGMKRQLDPYAAPTDTTTGMPAIGGGGQLLLPGTATLQPSLYRYPLLIERAKQLVQLAAQIEAGMFSALERRDAEAQTLLETKQQLNLAQAGLRLQELRVGEANDGVTLADLQQERVQIQAETYAEWIQADTNQYEKQMISAYGSAAAAQKGATEESFRIQEKQALIAAAQLAAQLAEKDPTGGFIAAGVGAADLAIDTYLFLNQSANTKNAIDATASAQIASVYAALERRKDEWRLQQRLAEQDSQIGSQQKKIAEDHVQIATQERAIAGIQADNAKDSVEFLTNKFTNVELFDRMVNILEGVYRFFLQQATATAKLGENQLAFERQEVPPATIKADYWDLPSENSLLVNADGQLSDLHGLTGSARLLQDIFQLDQYAFNTNKRKFPLTKTLSLARLAPVEFQRFRETGVLPFVTRMELFDRGFPGHYLRLIKRVRTSVIALIPPLEGIHATLSTTGPSRVVIGGDVFQTVPIKRAPEFIAMSSPSNSTGVLELDSQPDMLLPFEGSGVEMSWEFNLPKAANPFDYRTIADVLITLEYTALYSVDYRQQVIQSLKPTVNTDRPFSFRNQFPDQWYDLHNSEQTSTPMSVRFRTVRADFPPNLGALRIQQVLLYFVGVESSSEVPVSQLRYKAEEEPGPVGGSATSIDGMISTRRGNAGSWAEMIGKSPIGEWELALPDTEEMRKRFSANGSEGSIEDILLILTYSGLTPEWPD